MIAWETISKEEVSIITLIVKKALKKNQFSGLNYTDLDMDISATHISNPLKLQELLDNDGVDFSHDIAGISNHFNRTTGQLDNGFLPRFTK